MTEQDGDYEAPGYRQVLADVLWYLTIPVCLFFGIGAAVNVGLLIHIHVVEIGIYAQFDFVDEKWIYYANTAVYTVMFGALCWLLFRDPPYVTVIYR